MTLNIQGPPSLFSSHLATEPQSHPGPSDQKRNPGKKTCILGVLVPTLRIENHWGSRSSKQMGKGRPREGK